MVLPPSVRKATGAKDGDLVRVTAPNGKQVWAIVGDTSDDKKGRKLGEGSLKLHNMLGYNSTGNATAMTGNVSYEVFAGKSVVQSGSVAKMPTAEEIQAAGKKLGV